MRVKFVFRVFVKFVFQVCFHVFVRLSSLCVCVSGLFSCLCVCQGCKQACMCVCFKLVRKCVYSVKDRCPADSISYNYVESIMGLGVQRNMLKSRNEYLGIRLKENKNIFLILFMLSLIFTLFSYIIIRYKNYVLS